ncbi:MAG TPA: CpsB/CapC family capsule biosynthesis tyrosine phosphatase, partial [Gemmatimonadales bacterium]
MISSPGPFPVIDLHSHLAPGVDDGTRTVGESLEALRGLFREGVRAVVTTPHLLVPHLPTQDSVQRELDRHRRAFEELEAAC